jgi:Flp pilus assembly protein TadD
LKAALAESVVSPGPASYRRTADAYARLGVVDAALGQLQLALDADPHDPETLEARARLWRDAGFPQMALGDAYRALHYSHGSAPAHNTLGTILQSLGRRGEAATHYRWAAALDAGAAYAWNNLCYASLLDDRAMEAIERCRQALRLDPTLAAARNNLGLAYAAAGDLAAARDAFERAGSPAATAFNMGIVQLSVGMFRDAADSFQEAGRLQPTWAEPSVRLRQAWRRAGEGRPE